MRTAFIFVAATAPLACLGLWSALPGSATNGRDAIPQLPPLPSVSAANKPGSNQELIHVRLRSPLSMLRLGAALGVDADLLARLNGTSAKTELPEGHWCAVPAQHRSRLLMLSTIDASSVRSTPPSTADNNIAKTAPFRRGDTLTSFLRRHGIEEIELRQHNPGVDLNDLDVGYALRIPSSSGQSLLAIRPTKSGALSWPTIPSLSAPLSQPRQGPKYQWPTQGVFTSGYGWRWGRMHKGIDIANNTGTSIHAARDGKVTYAGWMGAYGYLVEIAHEDGESTRYAHNSRLMVRKGQQVRQGTRIALMGSTGRSTGPHLHFEIRRRGGGASNPLAVLPPRRS